MSFQQDFVDGLMGKANRNDQHYFNTENVLAIAAYFSLGWLLSALIGNFITKNVKVSLFAKPIGAIKFLITAGGEGVVSYE